MTRFASGLVLSVMIAVPLYAEDTAEYFAQRLLDNSEARVYLQMSSDMSCKDFSEMKLQRADINGDTADDYVLIGRHDDSVAIAAFLASTKDTGIDGAAWAGFVAVDSANMPTVRLEDVTGDGVADVRVEATRKIGDCGIRRVVKFAGMHGARLRTMFYAMLDDVERDQLNASRSTHLVRIKDSNGDGTNEIEVSTRTVELVGKGAKEREIPESITLTKMVYKLREGAYQLDSTRITAPTAEERLVVASKLGSAGEHQRAALTAHALLGENNIPEAIVKRARTILETSMGEGVSLSVQS